MMRMYYVVRVFAEGYGSIVFDLYAHSKQHAKNCAEILYRKTHDEPGFVEVKTRILYETSDPQRLAEWWEQYDRSST